MHITDDEGNLIGRMDFRRADDDDFMVTMAVQIGGGDTAMHSVVVEGFNADRLNAFALIQAALDELPEDAMRASGPALEGEAGSRGFSWPRLWLGSLGL